MHIFIKILCGVMVVVHTMMSSLSANQYLNEEEYKSLKKAVDDRRMEDVIQFVTSGKVDNTTMIENVPLANSILNTGHLDLLYYVMMHGIYLRLDDYMDSKEEIFSFVKKSHFKVMDSFMNLFKSEEENKILKIKEDEIDKLVDGWVFAASFFHEIKMVKEKPFEQGAGLDNWLEQEAKVIKEKMSPFLLGTTYKGKTIVDYILDLEEASLSKEFLSLFVDMQGVFGNTLLHYAVKQKKYSVIKIIRSIDFSYVNVKNEKGETPLMLAVREQDYDSVILFKYLGIDLPFDDLLILVHFLYQVLLPTTVWHNLDPNINLKLEYKEWLLHLLKNLTPDVFQKIFSYQDGNGNTLLHKAAIEANSEFLGILLDIHHSNTPNRVNQDIVNNKKESPLLLAVKNNHNAIVEKLLNLSNSNVDNVINSVDLLGDGILTHVVLNGNLIIFQQIIEYFYKNKKEKVLPWGTDKEGNTLFHLAAFKGNLEMFEQILFYTKEFSYDESINVKNIKGQTPLCIALTYGASRDFITFLLNNGASIDNVDIDNAGILHMAALGTTKEVYIDLEKKLSSKYTLLDNNERTPLFYACMSKNKDIISYLLTNKNKDQVDNEINTLLHALCWFIFPFRSTLCLKSSPSQDFVGFVQQLYDCADAQNYAGNTALNVLCQNECNTNETLAWINYLGNSILNIDADPNRFNNEGKSPLFYANKHNFDILITSLINAGAEPLHINDEKVDNLLQKLKDNNWADITPAMFRRHLKLGHVKLKNLVEDGEKITDPLIFLQRNEGVKFKLYFEYLNKKGDDDSKKYIKYRLSYYFNHINTNMIFQLLDAYTASDGKTYPRDLVLIEEFLNVVNISFTEIDYMQNPLSILFTIDHIKKAIDISPIDIHKVLLKHQRLQKIFNDNIKGLLEYILTSSVKNKWSSRLDIFKLYITKFEELGHVLLFPLNDNDDFLSHVAARNPDSIECLEFLLQEKEFKDRVHWKNKQELSVFDVAIIKENIPAINLLRPLIRANGIHIDVSIFVDENQPSYKRNTLFPDDMINNMSSSVVEFAFLKKIRNLSRRNETETEAVRNNKEIIELLRNEPFLMKYILIGQKPILHHIAESGSEDLFLEVLTLGLDKEVLWGVDIYGNTVLHVLARGGKKNLRKMHYLDQYVKLSGVKNHNYNIPLQLYHYSSSEDITKDDIACIDLLLTHYAVNPKDTCRISENPFARMKKDKNDFIERLQRISQRTNQSKDGDIDFLVRLIQDNHIHLLCALLYHASYYNLRNGEQLLLKSIEAKNVTAVAALVNHGAEITSSCWNKVNEMVTLESPSFFNKFANLFKKQEESSLVKKIKLFFEMQRAAWTCIENNAVLTDACSKLIENISPLACKNGTYPLHMLLKTIANYTAEDKLFYCIESIRWFITHGHILACNKKNKDGYLPIGIFLDNIEKYAMDKEVMLFIINLLLSHHVSHPILTGSNVYNPFIFACNVDGIKQLLQLASLHKTKLNSEDIAFIGDIIKAGYNHILFALLHHLNHLFTADILTNFLQKAFKFKKIDMFKGLVHYGTPLDTINVELWPEFEGFNNDEGVHYQMYEFVEKQRAAWLDLLSMIEHTKMIKDKKLNNKRIEDILVTLSPFALWKGNNPLHVVVSVENNQCLLLNRFLASHRIALDRLNSSFQTPLLKALHENFYQNALPILKYQKNNSFKLRDEVLTLINERINQTSKNNLTKQNQLKRLKDKIESSI